MKLYMKLYEKIWYYIEKKFLFPRKFIDKNNIN